MPETTHQVDHKAEALRLMEWLGDPIDSRTGATGDPRVSDALAAAQIRSNLAIAEGQERVAEELSEFNKRFESILAHSPNSQFGSGKRYLKVKP